MIEIVVVESSAAMLNPQRAAAAVAAMRDVLGFMSADVFLSFFLSFVE